MPYPTPRFRLGARLVLSGCTAAALLATLACTDSSTVTAAAVTGPPRLRIGGVVAAGPDGCVESGSDPHRTLVVKLGSIKDGTLLADGTLLNWTLQPPHGCDGTPQCGYVLLSMDGCDPATANAATGTCEADPSRHLQIIAVGNSVSVPMDGFTPPTGWFRVGVQLWNSDGTRAVDAKGAPFSGDSLVVNVEPRCGAAPDAGVDAARPDAARPDAAPDATPADGASPLDGQAPRSDAGAPDATPLRDAAAPDAARTPDAASPVDAAPARDATVVDATIRDAAPRG